MTAAGQDPGAFGATLAALMVERGISYRVLAGRTGLSAGYLNHLAHANRPTPANPVIETIARGLEVDPTVFREYRLRIVTARLEALPELLDRIYRELRA